MAKLSTPQYPAIKTGLLPTQYDPGFTNWNLRFNARTNADGTGPPERNGPMRTTSVPFAVIANAPAIVISVQNPWRRGLLMKNLDPVAALFVGIGQLASSNGFFLDPLGYVLFDFVCPTDAISVFAIANVNGYLAEMAPIAE